MLTLDPTAAGPGLLLLRRDIESAGAHAVAQAVIGISHAMVIAERWVTVRQLVGCEPTLVETVACMIGAWLKETLHKTANTSEVRG